MDGVPDGMTIVAGILSWRAEYATPWAWLPVLVQPGRWEALAFSFTSRTGHYALPAVFGVHVRHLVVGSSKLEAEDRLEVLALQQDLAFESITHVGGSRQRGFLDNIVDTRGENKFKVLQPSVDIQNKWE